MLCDSLFIVMAMFVDGSIFVCCVVCIRRTKPR